MHARVKWWWNKASRRAGNTFYRRLFRETNDDPEQAILVAGCARSGTTWLAEVIASQLPCRIMFEPFNWAMVDAYRRQFTDFGFRRPGEPDPALKAYATRVFSGRIRHPWVDREVNRLVFSQRLIKAVRANLFLKWLHQEFPQVPLLFIIRHPCAVVLSHIEAGWTVDQDIAAFLAQPALVNDFLSDKLPAIRRARTLEEKIAATWAIQNLVPLRQFSPDELSPVFYENLCRWPQQEVSRIFERLRQPFSESVFDRLERPSRMTARSSAILTGENRVSRWQQRLTEEQTRRILDIVANFDLDWLYGEGSMPLATRQRD